MKKTIDLQGLAVSDKIAAFDSVKGGRAFYVAFKNEIALPKKFAGHTLTKTVWLVARTKVDYKHTKAYFEKVALLPLEAKESQNTAKRQNPIKPIKSGYLYQNEKTGDYLIRFYGLPSVGNHSQYELDGKPASVDNLLSFGIAPSSLGFKADGSKKEKPACIYVKCENILSLRA